MDDKFVLQITSLEKFSPNERMGIEDELKTKTKKKVDSKVITDILFENKSITTTFFQIYSEDKRKIQLLLETAVEDITNIYSEDKQFLKVGLFHHRAETAEKSWF